MPRISIHAPHAGRDSSSRTVSVTRTDFNPRAPCGARPLLVIGFRNLMLFQSTRPMRGATSCSLVLVSISLYFNPRAPCGARLLWIGSEIRFLLFQSTRPMRGATSMDWFGDTFFIISIHAPHAGRDGVCIRFFVIWKYFNPRAPCGARPKCGATRSPPSDFNPRAPCGARRNHIRRGEDPCLFQSTRPMRGATAKRKPLLFNLIISIHAPHAGRDQHQP